MSYNAVPTVATGDVWSAANHNTYIRDNFATGVPDIFTAAGDIAYATAANAAAPLAIGTAGQVLLSSSDGLPQWGDNQIILARTGNSATDWTAVGTNIYTPTKCKAQICTGTVVFSNSSDTNAQVTVTFPVAYADLPIVIPFFNYVSISAGMTIDVTTITATNCLLSVNKISGSATLTYSVACLAIGDIT